MNFFRSLLVFSIVCFLYCCEKKNDSSIRPFPRIITGKVTDISSTGAKFNAEFIFGGTEDIIDYGFIWSLSDVPLFENPERYSFGPGNNIKSFSKEIKTTLLKNKIYYVCAYAKTNEKIVYGNAVNFVSLGSESPKIAGFFPHQGDIGDTLSIYGDNFSSQRDNNTVKFGSHVAEIVYNSNDTLKVTVPSLLDSPRVTISVSILNNPGYADDKFELLPPVINDIQPRTVVCGSIVRIKGRNFIVGHTSILIDTAKAEIVKISSGEITFRFPFNLAVGDLNFIVRVFDKQTQAAQTFLNKSPFMTSIQPTIASFGDTITISGYNFKGQTGNEKVLFNTIKAIIISINSDKILVIVPNDLNFYKSGITIFQNDTIYHNLRDVFQISPPEIYDFSPKIGTAGCWVTISGKYFSPVKSYNLVFFDNILATTIDSKKDNLIVQVPITITKSSEVMLNVIGQTTSFSEKFSFVNPSINHFSPVSGRQDTIIVADGNYSGTKELNSISINSLNAEVIKATNNQLTFRLPQNITRGEYPINLNIGNYNVSSDDQIDIIGPEINSISPLHGSFRDTVVIAGKNFAKNKSLLQIFIGDFSTFTYSIANIMYSDFNTIKISIPDPLIVVNSNININLAGSSVTSSQSFSIDPPVIESISPDSIALNSVVEIYGRNFSPVINNNTVVVYDETNTLSIACNIVDASPDKLVVQFPISVYSDNNLFKVSVLGRTVSSNKINVILPTITGFDLDECGWGQNVTIFGKGFITDKSNIRVRFGGLSAYIGNVTPNSIIAQAPGIIGQAVYVEIDFATLHTVSPKKIIFPWKDKISIPDDVSNNDPYVDGVSFSINDKGYWGLGEYYGLHQPNNKLWAYDPVGNLWERKADFPGKSRKNSISFVTNGKGYVGFGLFNNDEVLKDFWEYDPVNDSWKKLNDFPGTERHLAIGKGISDKGYAGLGIDKNNNILSDIWQYDPVNDSWLYLTDMPSGPRYKAGCYNLYSNLYIINGSGNNVNYNDFWEYNPILNSWKQLESKPEGVANIMLYYELNNNAYAVGAAYGRDVANYMYNPLDDSWQRKADVLQSFSMNVISFTIDNKSYYGPEILVNSGLYGWWEYNPELK